MVAVLEEERLTDLRESRVREDAARATETDAAMNTVPEREMGSQPLPAPAILDRDAQVFAHVVLRVSGHEDLVQASLFAVKCHPDLHGRTYM